MKTHWYPRCENAKSLTMTKSNLDPIPLTGLVQLIGFYQARTDPQDWTSWLSRHYNQKYITVYYEGVKKKT